MNNTWAFGANFIPSSAINQLEMWQKETYDPETIRRELALAEKIGMTRMRVFLHDLLFLQDRDGFFSRIEDYLRIADSFGIKTMFVFFDDCWRGDFQLGKQPDPVPYTHNSGWVQSPGPKAADDPAQRRRLEEYVKAVLTTFKTDGRIFAWDLYNEPGNGAGGDHWSSLGLRLNASLPLLKDVFSWAKQVRPDQGITSGVWQWTEPFKDLIKVQFEESDLVSFHTYQDPEGTRKLALDVLKVASGRPVFCTEYMARTAHSTFGGCLPVFRELGIGAINWGLVSGKTQTVYPWGWNAEKGEPKLPFHDVFHPDGSFLVPAEEKVFESMKKH